MNDKDLIDLYVKVCLKAEKIMQETHVVSGAYWLVPGAHWNAFRSILGEKLLDQAEKKLAEARANQNE